MNTRSSRLLPRLAAASVGVLIALPALSGGVALAATTESAGKSDKASQGQSQNAPSSSEAKSSGKPSGKSSEKKASPKAKPSKAAKSTGDPAGNNGTIKIQPFGGIAGNSNTPHPGCDFRLQMFNFDDDQTGTITFVGQAPTKDAVTQQPLAGSQLLSDDPAGGGKDRDAFYDVRGASLGLTGAPGPKGYHVKVLVDADDAPGGAKQKVFWLDCPAPAPAPAEGAGEGEGEGGGAVTPLPDETTAPSPAPAAPVEASEGAAGAPGSTNVAGEFTGGAGETTLFGTESRTTAEGSAQGSAQSGAQGSAEAQAAASEAESRPIGALPFTGVELSVLVLIALAALGTGAYFLYAGRRRTV